jgi:hypothetical protein
MRLVLLLLSMASIAHGFMLPATRLAFQRSGAAVARPGAAGRRMQLSRSLMAMAANPKVRCVRVCGCMDGGWARRLRMVLLLLAAAKILT